VAAFSPQEVIERFSSALADGDLDALIALYEPEAAFSPTPGDTVTGHGAIREALAGFLAAQPRMEGEIQKVLEVGDTALVANRWRLRGTRPDGEPLELAGVSADVMRRRSDGSWGILIDDPWGAAAS
jgi:uncharacterized protein (TIGR02246 family)